MPARITQGEIDILDRKRCCRLLVYSLDDIKDEFTRQETPENEIKKETNDDRHEQEQEQDRGFD